MATGLEHSGQVDMTVVGAGIAGLEVVCVCLAHAPTRTG